MPDHVNGCVTRAIARGGLTNLGSGPSLASASLAQATSVALGLAAHQSVVTQAAADTAQQVAVLGGIANLFAIDTAPLVASDVRILKAN